MVDNLVNGTINDEIKEFRNLDYTIQELINQAIQARKRAYCPYSNFSVGAAIQTTTGEIYTGCNIENSSFSPTVCAERTALVKAVSEGHREFVACAIVAHNETNFVSPCGVCRQTLMEFVPKGYDLPIYLAKPSPCRVLCTTLRKLLPYGFRPEDLQNNLHFND